MTRGELLAFIREHSLAVQASVSSAGTPQAAVVGVVVTDAFELFFDTLATSRKTINLRQRPRIAFVIGGPTPGDERTVQFEGAVDEPVGSELQQLKDSYFQRFPDGRDRARLADVTYWRATPTWIRYSDFGQSPPTIVEFEFPGTT